MSNHKKRTLAEFPDLMLDWDPLNNSGIRPEDLTSGSHQVVVWTCHKCGRRWSCQVRNRIQGTGCTCDAMARKTASLRKKLVARDGSLAEHRPDLAAQWHPTKNGDLSPWDVTCSSTYAAWWIDAMGREWKTQVSVRCRNPSPTGAPAHIVYPGHNDLANRNPELSAEWDPDRNGELTPEQVSPGSNQLVWWRCKKGHTWPAIVSSRVSGRGCPICSQERNTSFPEQALLYYLRKLGPSVYNRYQVEKHLEIDLYFPDYKLGIEYDGAYYHRSRKKEQIDARKNKRLKELGITLIRVLEDGITPPSDTEHIFWSHRGQLDHVIVEVLNFVSQYLGSSSAISVDTKRDQTEIWEGYITEAKENSIAVKCPELLSQWHPTKNGSLKPEYIPYGSNKRLWWKCTQCGYEWQSPVASRTRGTRCPVCTGNIAAEGINDLCTTHPDLVKEWNFGKNKDLSPKHYSAGSGKYVWWVCSTCGFEWQAAISNRTRNRNCPRCIGKVTAPEKSLARTYPHLAQQWCFSRNGELTPQDVLPHSDKKVWWQCSAGHTWSAAISSRVRGNGCPYCGNKRILPGYNDFASTHPELLKEWDYHKNSVQPTEIFAGSQKKVYWLCGKGHSWQATVHNRVHGNNCPYCAGKYAVPGETDLTSNAPLLAEEWHPEKNRPLTPQNVTAGSSRKVWWKCRRCGFEWQAIVWSRCKGRGCPRCAGKIKSPSGPV